MLAILRYLIIYPLLGLLAACAAPGQSPPSGKVEAPPDIALLETKPSTTQAEDAITELRSKPATTRIPQYTLQRSGNLIDSRAPEISGMAISNVVDDRLWMVNDSGNSASLMAFTTRGEFLASFKTNQKNRDWESLSSFIYKDQAYLLVADTGDNLALHQHYRLHFFAEPTALQQVDSTTPPLKPIATLKFIYPDGHHDSEAVAVSVKENLIILLTKDAKEAGVYSLPLRFDTAPNTITATRLGSLADIPQTLTDRLIYQFAGVRMTEATALDINARGDVAFVLTYRGIYAWRRDNPSENWGTVLARPAQLITRHSLAQSEAMAEKAGHLYFLSERLPSPILHLLPAPPS